MYIIKDYNTPTCKPEKVWKALGWNNQEVNEELRKKTEEAIALIERTARPKSILLTGDLKKDGNRLTFYDIELEGETIKDFLETSRSAALMAVTLGIEVDRIIKRMESVDLTFSLLLDTAASLIVEEICDLVTDSFEKQEEKEGIYITERFSPGYSDLPLTIQPKLLKLLDASRRIGLTTTQSCLLFPRKSVTAFIGLMDHPRKIKSNRCLLCRLKGQCKYGICYQNT